MDFFDFVPPPVYAAAGVGVNALVKKKRAKKYGNRQAQDLANRFPPASDSSKQEGIISAMERERTDLELQRTQVKSKKTRQSLDARIIAYNEVLKDARQHLADLQDLEQKAAASAQTTTTTTTEVPGGAQTDVVLETQPKNIGAATTTDPLLESAIPDSNKKPNYLLWVGIGAVVLLLVLRKR
jgi:hypothetical protein